MPPKKLSEAREKRLAAAAEAARDDDRVVLRESGVRVSADATGVLSVRLPLAQIRLLREVANSRGESLSELLQEALGRLLGSAGPDVSMSSVRQMIFYSGGGLPRASTESGPLHVRPNLSEAPTGSFVA